MTEVEIKDAQITDLKKTLRQQEREIDTLKERQADLIGYIEIYQKNNELLNKVLDKTGNY
jgi:predicted RNase H-like nuclease (RuvC/YqgF family)